MTVLYDHINNVFISKREKAKLKEGHEGWVRRNYPCLKKRWSRSTRSSRKTLRTTLESRVSRKWWSSAAKRRERRNSRLSCAALPDSTSYEVTTLTLNRSRCSNTWTCSTRVFLDPSPNKKTIQKTRSRMKLKPRLEKIMNIKSKKRTLNQKRSQALIKPMPWKRPMQRIKLRKILYKSKPKKESATQGQARQSRRPLAAGRVPARGI